jgi:hypothetical protein
MTDPNTNFSTLLSTTLNKHREKLADNIFSARPLTYWLVDRKGRKRMEKGGVKIVEPLIYAENTGFSSYADYDRISITPQTGITAAEYEWRQLAVPVVISGIEEFKNQGDSAVINLLEAKVTQAEETMKAQMNVMLFGDGTGNGGKDWLGLRALVGDHDLGPATVGNINCETAGNEFWRSGVDYNAGATVLTEAIMRSLYNSATDGGNDVPDFGVTTLALFEKYESLLTTNMRYTDELSANLGFTNLTYKGKPIFWDGDCPAGYMFFLNSKYLTLVGGADRWFKSTPFTSPFDSAHASSGAGTFVDARYSVITTYGQFTTNNRRKHAVGNNFTTA